MAGGGGGSEYEVGINLTALLDVLTNLLFFLLVGFAAQQHSVEVEGGVNLPETSSEAEPKKDVELIISKTEVWVGGKVVARIQGSEVVGKTDARGVIVPIYEALLERKHREVVNADANILFVLADKDLPYKALRRVLTTAAQAGFAKYRLGALMQ